MQRVTHSEFIAARAAFDRAVAGTPNLLPFCSSSTWSLAARRHLRGLGDDEEEGVPGEREDFEDTMIWRAEDGGHWAVFDRSTRGYWQPFESAWMFGCPLIGPDPAESVARLREIAAHDSDFNSGFAIGGVPVGGKLHQALRESAASGTRHYREFPGIDCLTIDLSSGWEAWLARRSRKFRRSLRAAARRCREAGLTLEVIGSGPRKAERSGADALFDRLLAIHPRTRKWAEGSDIFQHEGYRRFYGQIFHELSDRGALRVIVAVREGVDVAHIFGGIFAGEYRGLQMSHAAEVAPLGVGNWLQMENLRRLAAGGGGLCNLGMESEYKLRWADGRRSLLVAFLAP